MKKLLSIIVLICVLQPIFGQDSEGKEKRSAWKLNSFGLSHMDGNIQFFEGYNREILYANAQYGLPIYTDWNVFSGAVVLPEFYQFGANAGLVDTARGLKLRLGATYTYRKDSMVTSGAFAVNDTIVGRNASEKGTFISIAVAGMKQTRKLAGFLRLYGGAEVEFGLSPRSEIFFVEFQYDFGDQRAFDINTFNVVGKPRFNLFVCAILGFEMIFLHHFGITAEVKSGLGMQKVLREKSNGLAKNSYHLGLNYHLWDYQRKKRAIEIAPEIQPSATPLPGF